MRIHSQISKRVYSKKYSFLDQAFHSFGVLTSKIFTQLGALFIGFYFSKYAGATIFGNAKYHYAKISDESLFFNYIKTEVPNYALISILSILFIELILISAINILFAQDRSFKNQTLWSTKCWFGEIFMVVIQILTQLTFALGTEVFLNEI